MVWKAQDFCYIFKAPVKDVKKKKVDHPTEKVFEVHR